MIDFIPRVLASSAVVNCPGNGGSCPTGIPKITAGNGQVHQLLVIVFGIAAVIAVLMIIIGGFLYVTSGGNPEKTTRARETIIYAIVGLVVSLSAEFIVGYVLTQLKK